MLLHGATHPPTLVDVKHVHKVEERLGGGELGRRHEGGGGAVGGGGLQEGRVILSEENRDEGRSGRVDDARAVLDENVVAARDAGG